MGNARQGPDSASAKNGLLTPSANLQSFARLNDRCFRVPDAGCLLRGMVSRLQSHVLIHSTPHLENGLYVLFVDFTFSPM